VVDYLDRLSAFVSGTTFEDLDDAALAAVKDVLLDTLGAILAGSQLRENANLAAFAAQASGKATSTILGHSLKADPMYATMANATAGVSLEMDEGSRLGGGHPSIHTTPGAIAVAEEMGTSGKRLVESILVGYEVESRIGTGTRVRPNVHSHGTWGTIGTAVAVSKLFGYDERQVREVMNLAVSMSPANSWTPCFEGANVRNLYPGRSGFQGILAVHLHRCGYRGLQDGPSDVYGTILGESFDPETVVAGLGDGYRIQQNYFKMHACCYFNHPALDATLALVRQEEITHQEIDWVRVTSIPFAAERMNGDYPQNMLSAKFAVPYAVAASIVRGSTDITAFYEDAIAESRTRDLALKVEVDSDPRMSVRRTDYPSARVSIGLKDGRVLTESTVVARGDAALNPVPRETLVDKFMYLSTPVLGQEAAKRVVEVVGDVDQLEDIRELTSLLVPG
jgi:2-methylcitrate dehydratase PrpD